MYIRTAHWKCKPECSEESIELFRTLVLQTVEKDPDCIGIQLMGEGTNRIAVTIFRSEAEYRNWKRRTKNLKGITDAFAHMYIDDEPPVPFDYPILVSRIFDEPKKNEE